MNPESSKYELPCAPISLVAQMQEVIDSLQAENKELQAAVNTFCRAMIVNAFAETANPANFNTFDTQVDFQ